MILLWVTQNLMPNLILIHTNYFVQENVPEKKKWPEVYILFRSGSTCQLASCRFLTAEKDI